MGVPVSSIILRMLSCVMCLLHWARFLACPCRDAKKMSNSAPSWRQHASKAIGHIAFSITILNPPRYGRTPKHFHASTVLKLVRQTTDWRFPLVLQKFRFPFQSFTTFHQGVSEFDVDTSLNQRGSNWRLGPVSRNFSYVQECSSLLHAVHLGF